MPRDNSRSAANRGGPVTRRGVLRAAAGGALVAGSAIASATSTTDGGFPPNGTTRFGDEVTLGAGSVRPFTTETPAGEPTYHGVDFDREVFTGTLPSAADLAADRTGDDSEYVDKYSQSGRALEVHHRESLEFFVPFPDAESTPFTFLGLNWNPEGHAGARGAWAEPHFDVHFHMLGTDTVDAIEGPDFAPYDDIAGAKIPTGYERSPPAAADERYVTDMGEHLAPSDAPEVPGNPAAFTNTLIQGFVSADSEPELAFVEPMLTREFLREFEGTARYEVPQPAIYPHGKQHPTAYSVRADPASDTVAVALQEFESV